ncbi:MAG TPA: D-tyrosyl-tRNA(Tyr) deacylase, partial [Piscirickettsiaceae bacterium]|nr:D-tyrosyl-tRNA(Tyr) deacylase [Piscirickettsiaceae bacterium]
MKGTKQRTPGFSSAAPPQEGDALYRKFCEYLREQGTSVETGRFGADMQVTLTNDGPVTIW